MNGMRHTGGGIQPPPPVQSKESRTEDQQTSVKIPGTQAVLVSTSATLAILCFIVAPALIGERILFFIAGIMSLAAFIWSLNYESRWFERVTIVVLPSAVAWFLWAFTDSFGWAVPESWQPGPALLAMVLCIFFWFLTVLLILAFVQELAYRSPFQEYAIFTALGELLKLWGQKRLEHPAQQEQPERRIVIEVNEQKAGGITSQMNLFPPVGDVRFTSLCQILNSGKSLTEVNVCGNGKPLGGREELHKVQDWFVSRHLARWKVTQLDGEPERRQGMIFDALGKKIIEKVLAPPPHPPTA